MPQKLKADFTARENYTCYTSDCHMVAMFQKILGRSADDIVELQQRADGGGAVPVTLSVLCINQCGSAVGTTTPLLWLGVRIV